MSKFKVFNAGLFLVLCVVGCSTQSTKTQNPKVQNAKAVPISELVCDKEPNKWAVFKKINFKKTTWIQFMILLTQLIILS